SVHTYSRKRRFVPSFALSCTMAPGCPPCICVTLFSMNWKRLGDVGIGVDIGLHSLSASSVIGPQLLPRDHASHSSSKERPSNTGANPLLLNKSHTRCFGLAISRAQFVRLACI